MAPGVVNRAGEQIGAIENATIGVARAVFEGHTPTAMLFGCHPPGSARSRSS